jgi:hypothetical protein
MEGQLRLGNFGYSFTYKGSDMDQRQWLYQLYGNHEPCDQYPDGLVTNVPVMASWMDWGTGPGFACRARLNPLLVHHWAMENLLLGESTKSPGNVKLSRTGHKDFVTGHVETTHDTVMLYQGRIIHYPVPDHMTSLPASMLRPHNGWLIHGTTVAGAHDFVQIISDPVTGMRGWEEVSRRRWFTTQHMPVQSALAMRYLNTRITAMFERVKGSNEDPKFKHITEAAWASYEAALVERGIYRQVPTQSEEYNEPSWLSCVLRVNTIRHRPGRLARDEVYDHVLLGQLGIERPIDERHLAVLNYLNSLDGQFETVAAKADAYLELIRLGGKILFAKAR